MNNTDERDFNKILETIQSLEAKIDSNFLHLLEQVVEIHKMSKQDLLDRREQELEKAKQIGEIIDILQSHNEAIQVLQSKN
tara:strand:- start:103 stop:345 length:243 start_codon:yes stop_codon:yes gene_type:complete